MNLRSFDAKQLREQATFRRFVERLGTEAEWRSVTSKEPPEPDLACEHAARGLIAFELVSLTDPAIARVIAAGPLAFTGAFSTADPTSRIVRDKLHKTYVTQATGIDLLIYTEGQLVTPDDVVIPTLRPWIDAISHQFERVWFMGEVETLCLWRR